MEPSAFASVFENEEWLGSELNLAEGHGGPSSGLVVEQNGTQAKQLSKNSMKLFVDPSNMGKNQEDGGESCSDQDLEGVGTKNRTKAKSPTKRRGSTVDRRRERNRVLARKTRLRKKYFFEVRSLLTSTVKFGRGR